MIREITVEGDMIRAMEDFDACQQDLDEAITDLKELNKFGRRKDIVKGEQRVHDLRVMLGRLSFIVRGE